MRISFIAKRHYTNKDALAERFGRVYQLPLAWHRQGHAMQLQLLDYRSLSGEAASPDDFPVESFAATSPLALRRLVNETHRHRPDVVVAAGDCMVGMLGLRLARSTNAAFVFDAYDDYRTFGSHRIFMGWDAFSWLVGKADAVFYASHRLAATHGGAGPALLVPNGVDASRFQPGDPSEARRAAALPEAGRLVGYFGSMERDRGVNVLLDAMRKLRAGHPDLHLLVAGRGHADTPIAAIARSAPWVHYMGQVPHSQIPGLLNSCDVLALPYLRSPIMDMGVSCKIAEYLFCRRPIAATRTPNLEANFPVQTAELADRLAEPGNEDSLADSLLMQLQHPRLASVPVDMAWGQIAAMAAARLSNLVADRAGP